MRKKIVAGNWKMNNDIDESKNLAEAVLALVKSNDVAGVQAVLCPPFVNLSAVGDVIHNSAISLGAQNCYPKSSGAFTGETSLAMLKSVGAQFVIIGHSERREYFNETNAFVKEKVDAILENGNTPIFCCGESLEQREGGVHIDFVKAQLTESLFHLDAEGIKSVVIAYEPIWAIGTGVTASTEQAQEMHKILRDHIASNYSQEVADEVSILYGGSCKPGNAPELFACPDVDGGLIGGASLKAQDFVDIIKSF